MQTTKGNTEQPVIKRVPVSSVTWLHVINTAVWSGFDFCLTNNGITVKEHFHHLRFNGRFPCKPLRFFPLNQSLNYRTLGINDIGFMGPMPFTSSNQQSQTTEVIIVNNYDDSLHLLAYNCYVLYFVF